MSGQARRFRGLRAIILVVAGLAVPPVSAQIEWNRVGIGGVTVQPPGLVTPDDPVSLDVRLFSGSAPIQLFQPTMVQILANEIYVDIHAGSGHLTVLDSLVTSVSLGTLLPGSYTYRVTQNGPAPPDRSMMTGGFLVVPEPCALSMLALASLLALRRRA